jgi:protein-disulfide isomerase
MALQKLIEYSNRGGEEGVRGTPTFFINGEMVPSASSWAALKPALDKAAGR